MVGARRSRSSDRPIDLLVPGGILVLVCPVNQVFGKSQMCELLDTWFDQLELYLFPDRLPVVQGVRRLRPSSQDGADGRADLRRKAS